MTAKEYVKTGLYILGGLILAALLLAEWILFGIGIYCWYFA